jgi:hypothetical protein
MPLKKINDYRSDRNNIFCSVVLEDNVNLLYLGIRLTTLFYTLGYIGQEYPEKMVVISLYDPDLHCYDYLSIYYDEDVKRYYLVERSI